MSIIEMIQSYTSACPRNGGAVSQADPAHRTVS